MFEEVHGLWLENSYALNLSFIHFRNDFQHCSKSSEIIFEKRRVYELWTYSPFATFWDINSTGPVFLYKLPYIVTYTRKRA